MREFIYSCYWSISNLFHFTDQFLHPLKILRSQMFSDVFKGYKISAFLKYAPTKPGNCTS